jgi:hypothetical protein
MLLAIGMVITTDEFVLSYALGGAFLLMSAFLMYKLGLRLFGNRVAGALAGAAIIVLEPRLLWVSLSGMETSLFLALLLAVYVFYLEKRPSLLGISAGLLLWTRPEALLMVGILIVDVVYRQAIVQKSTTRDGPSAQTRRAWPIRSLIICLGFGLAYGVFNFALSGSLFPNTLAAKLKYYSAGGQGFPSQVLWFLTSEHMIVLAPFVVVGALTVALALVRRRAAPLLVPFLWSLGMIGAYWWKLPYLYQYGRYLMPILPFVVLLGIGGLEELLRVGGERISVLKTAASRKTVCAVILFATVGGTAYGAWQRQDYYGETCMYIAERQVTTARWIRDHLPKEAIVATHDVGALAFYSGRRIVDMVGLISPEMIENIGRLDRLIDYLKDQNVTHLAVLRTWFEINNVHPLYMTDELRPEIMEVFRFDPERIHFTNKTASLLSERARLELAAGNVQQAGAMLEQALQYDVNSARIHLLLGRALILVGRLDDAEREFGIALDLQPDLWDARFGQADVAARRQKPEQAIVKLEELVRDNPEYVSGYQALAQLYYRTRIDTAKAAFYLRRFNEATKKTGPGLP